MQRWEYCYLVGVNQGEYYHVELLTTSGLQRMGEATQPVKDRYSMERHNIYAQQVAKLGNDGWEIIEQDTNGYTLFKRPKPT